MVTEIERVIGINERIGAQKLIKTLNELLIEYGFVDWFLIDISIRDKTPIQPWQPYYRIHETTSVLKSVYIEAIGFLSELLFIYYHSKWIENRDNRIIRIGMMMFSKKYPRDQLYGIDDKVFAELRKKPFFKYLKESCPKNIVTLCKSIGGATDEVASFLYALLKKEYLSNWFHDEKEKTSDEIIEFFEVNRGADAVTDALDKAYNAHTSRPRYSDRVVRKYRDKVDGMLRMIEEMEEKKEKTQEKRNNKPSIPA